MGAPGREFLGGVWTVGVAQCSLQRAAKMCSSSFGERDVMVVVRRRMWRRRRQNREGGSGRGPCDVRMCRKAAV